MNVSDLHLQLGFPFHLSCSVGFRWQSLNNRGLCQLLTLDLLDMIEAEETSADSCHIQKTSAGCDSIISGLLSGNRRSSWDGKSSAGKCFVSFTQMEAAGSGVGTDKFKFQKLWFDVYSQNTNILIQRKKSQKSSNTNSEEEEDVRADGWVKHNSYLYVCVCSEKFCHLQRNWLHESQTH